MVANSTLKISAVASNDSIAFPCLMPAKSAIKCFKRAATFGPSLHNISVTHSTDFPTTLLELQLLLLLLQLLWLLLPPLLELQLSFAESKPVSMHCRLRCSGGFGLALRDLSSCRLLWLLLEVSPSLLTSEKQHTFSLSLAVASTGAVTAASSGTDGADPR